MLKQNKISFSNSITAKNEIIFVCDFTEPDKKIVLSLHYNGGDSYLFVNGAQQLKFKTKDSEIKRVHLSLGNLSTDFSTTNMTKTGLYGNAYDFAVDYVPINGLKTIYDII